MRLRRPKFGGEPPPLSGAIPAAEFDGEPSSWNAIPAADFGGVGAPDAPAQTRAQRLRARAAKARTDATRDRVRADARLQRVQQTEQNLAGEVEGQLPVAASGLKGMLGKAGAVTLASPIFTVGLVAATAVASWAAGRKDSNRLQSESELATLKQDITKLDFKDQAAATKEVARIKALAGHEDSIWQRGLEGLHLGKSKSSQAYDDVRKAALQADAPMAADRVKALERIGALRLITHVKDQKALDSLLAGLAEGNEGDTRKINEILTSVLKGLNPEQRLQFSAAMKLFSGATDAEKKIEEVQASVDSSTQQLAVGRITGEQHLATLEAAKQGLADTIANYATTGQEVPEVMLKAYLDAIKQVQDAKTTIADVALGLLQATIENLKAHTRDPQKLATLGVQSAKAAVVTARGHYADAVKAHKDALEENARNAAAAVADDAAVAALDPAVAAEEERLQKKADEKAGASNKLIDDYAKHRDRHPSPSSVPGQDEKKKRDAAAEAARAAQAELDAYRAAHPEIAAAATAKTHKAGEKPVAPPPPKDPDHLTPDEQKEKTLYESAMATLAQSDFAQQQADDAVADSKIKLNRVKEGGAKNALKTAKESKEDADRMLARAKSEDLGVATENEALIAQIEADRAISDAIFQIGQSRLDLLQAVSKAAGRDTEAALISVQEVRNELQRQIAQDPTDTKAINDLKAQLVSQSDQASATHVSETKELIDFRLQMHEITVGQAIAQMTALLNSPDVQSNEDRVREIRSAIQALKDQVGQNLAFNIGELRLPTLYEVRRTRQSSDMGAGYNDNRQVSIVMHNYNATDYQGSVDQMVELFGQPSRYGKQPSLYPNRN